MAKSSVRRQARKQGSTTHQDPLLAQFITLQASMEHEKAYQLGQKLASKYSNNRQFLYLFAECCFNTGHYEEAINAYNGMLRLNPNETIALYQIGKIAILQGHTQQATELFIAALRHNPSHTASFTELEKIYFEQKQWEYLLHVIKLHLKQHPEHRNPWYYLSKLRATLDIYLSFPEIETILLEHIPRGDVGEKYSVYVALDIILRHHKPFADLVQITFDEGENAIFTYYERYNVNEILSSLDHPLLICFLNYTVVPDLHFEKTIAGVRYALMKAWNNSCDKQLFEDHSNHLPILSALASYFFTTEHIANVQEEEKNWHAQLRHQCEALLAEEAALKPVDLWRFCLLACYQNLDTLPHSERLIGMVRTVGVEEVTKLVQAICEDLLHERRVAANIPTFTEIKDNISQAVREQYEESPYPRWRYVNLQTTNYKNAAIHAKYSFPQASSYDIRIPDAFDVLVAGCGTGRHPITVATRYPKANITCIDLSARSLAYAQIKAKQTPFHSRLQFMHGDILEVGALRKIYHMIESVGVLHHMKDPMAGWRKLVGILKPGGLMRIGLYSKIARQQIIEAREEIAQLGYSDSIEDIRTYRRELLKRDNLGFRLLNDFYSTSECRDLLFHRQEHQFTIPMIKQALKELGLVFFGFDLPQEILDQYYARFPEDMRVHHLDHWEIIEHEHPNTFLGMYQFWCYKPA